MGGNKKLSRRRAGDGATAKLNKSITAARRGCSFQSAADAGGSFIKDRLHETCPRIRRVKPVAYDASVVSAAAD